MQDLIFTSLKGFGFYGHKQENTTHKRVVFDSERVDVLIGEIGRQRGIYVKR